MADSPGGGLNERDKIRIKGERPRGILNVTSEEAMQAAVRYWPSAALAPFVEHYWIVRWDLESPQVAETMPQPVVHMVLEAGSSELVGVLRTRFTRELVGSGRVVGTRFRAGGFRPFVTAPIATLTDRRLPLAEVLGPRARDLEREALRSDDDLESIACIEAFLSNFSPVADDSLQLVGRIVSRIADDRGVTKVEQLEREFHASPRQLQRLFRENVGVGPKWVIQRYRLLEAADRVADGKVVDWACLALDLGFADQAHFIRDFKKLVGCAPAAYARRLERPGRGGEPRSP